VTQPALKAHETVTTAVKRVLYSTGHYARVLSGAAFSGLVVLCYHNLRGKAVPASALPFAPLHVAADEFARQCRFIHDTCHPISLDDWRSARSARLPLPARAVLVTFDDGYRSIVTIAKPVLEAHRIPYVVFACTGAIADRSLFWFDAVARQESDAAVDVLKRASWSEWQSRVANARIGAAADDPSAPLTVDDLKALAASPLVEIGAHTVTHPILARAPLSAQQREIERSRDDLEAWTGRTVRAFAFPNGRPRIDYSEATVTLLERLGFDIAFTTDSRMSVPDDAPLELPRFLVMAGMTAPDLAHRFAYRYARR
jgi:peptidoglycan/xylan/chitin deacetylase (PgdA/CDA1 family)